MPPHTARRGEGQPSAERHQREKPVLARVLDDHDAFADAQERNGFVRIVIAILNIRRTAHDLVRRIQHINVVVIGGRAHGIGPKQVQPGKTAAGQDRVVGHAAKVMQSSDPGQRRGTAVFEIPLPRARTAFKLAASVAGRRKKQRARRGNVVHRL